MKNLNFKIVPLPEEIPSLAISYLNKFFEEGVYDSRKEKMTTDPIETLLFEYSYKNGFIDEAQGEVVLTLKGYLFKADQ